MNGLLLPVTYVVRSKYLTHWSYRVTWYVLIAGIILNALMVVAWMKLEETRKEAEDVSKALMQNEAELGRKKAETEPIIAKYKELSDWQAQRRLPLTPVLDTIEKHFASDYCLLNLDWDIPTVKSGGRAGNMTMKVFSDDAEGEKLLPSTAWLQSVKKALDKYKINCGEITVSDPTPADGGNTYTIEFALKYGGEADK